jgi:hypothetical protein
MTDAPGRALDWLAAIAGARLGARIGGGSFAGGLQTAQRTSSLFSDLAQKLTNDEAKNLLIRATKEPKLFNELMRDVRRMDEKQQMDLLNRIVAEAKDLTSRIKGRTETTQAPASAEGQHNHEDFHNCLEGLFHFASAWGCCSSYLGNFANCSVNFANFEGYFANCLGMTANHYSRPWPFLSIKRK